MNLHDLAIRVTKQGGDRCLLVGASRSGKSTLAGILIDLFYHDYVAPKKGARPRGRILVVDSKPRWRPEMLADGSRATKRFKEFLPGTQIAHSRLVTSPRDWDLAWKTGEGVVVLQNHKIPQPELIRFSVEMMGDYFQKQKHTVPSLLVIDEGMDFFGPTGNGKYGDIVQRSVRAGGEKGLASLINVQRPKTINLQVITESNYLALFELHYRNDVKRLWEMGVPPDLVPPKEPHHFALWRQGRLLTRDAILNMKES